MGKLGALSAANNHLLRSKIAYLEGDSLKALQHATIAANIAVYAIFNRIGGIERVIAAAEQKISELESIEKPPKKVLEKSDVKCA